jgi:hypothetical protein
VSDVLPRQTYNTDSDALTETRIAEAFAAWGKAKQLKLGEDDPDKLKSRCDRLLYREHLGRVVAFFEVKNRKFDFGSLDGGWAVGRRKYEALRQLKTIVRLPVFYVVGFQCRTIAFVEIDQPHVIKPNFGPNRPRDAGEYEDGVWFQWSQLRKIF